MLTPFNRPVQGQPHFAGGRQLAQRLGQDGIGQAVRGQPLVVQQAREALDRRFLVAQAPGQLGLAAGLFLNDRPHKGGDPFELMPMCPGKHLRDILSRRVVSESWCVIPQVSHEWTLVATRLLVKCPDIRDWGYLTHVWLTFYEFKEVSLVFLFHPECLTGLNVDQIEKYLQASPNQLYGMFEMMAKRINEENPKGYPGRFTACLENEKLQIGGRPVAGIEFSAAIALRKQELKIPSVVAYDAPGVIATERGAFIEKVELGEFEITSSSNNVLVTLDLSPVEIPPNWKFHGVDFDFNRVVTIQGFEIIGPLKMQILLREVYISLAPRCQVS